MKILHLIIYVICVTFIVGCATSIRIPPSEASIVGIWTGKDEKGIDGAFVFNADGSADVLKRGVSIKGNTSRNKGNLSYLYNPSTTPAALDIVLTRKTGERITMNAIVMFLSEDSIKLRISTSGSRPLDFSGAPSDIIVLHRQAKP